MTGDAGKTSGSQYPKPFWKRRSYYAAAIVFCLFLLVWPLYRKICPSPTVPTSHFVKEVKQRKVIIFVHGILGDMDNTWINARTHASWPELLASDKDMSDYDVYVYGYESPCNGSASNIYEIANRFGQQLKDDGFFSNYQEIAFIAHSMGGLVTERMLAGLNAASESDKLWRVHSVLFIAVPSRGADIASTAAWLSSNPQFRNMDPTDAQALLQATEADWATIRRNRTPVHPFPRSFVAYETKDIGQMRVVPALFTSQESDLSPIAFDYDHINIVKPESRDSDVYKWAKARIRESSSLDPDLIKTHMEGWISPVPSNFEQVKIVVGEENFGQIDATGHFWVPLVGVNGSVRLRVYVEGTLRYDDFQDVPGPHRIPI